MLMLSIHDLKRTGLLLILLNSWLWIGGMIMVAISVVAVGGSVRDLSSAVALPLFAAGVIYIEDRRWPSEEDYVNAPVRTELVLSHARLLKLSSALFIAGYQTVLLYCILTGGISFLPSTVWYAGVAFLGGQVPFLVFAVYDRAKRIVWGDALAVGIAWSYLVVYSTLLVVDLPATGAAVGVFFAWLAITSAGVMARNLRDVTGDTRADKPPLVAVLGNERATATIVGLKSAGVAVFALMEPLAAVAVGGYLVYLRLCREYSQRLPERTDSTRLIPSADPDHRR